jgi:CHAT domain-containing protein
LALDYAAINDFQRAHQYNKKVQEIENKLIERILGFTSERQKMNFLTKQKGDLYSFLSLIAQHLPQNKMARQDGLDLWLKRKGMVLEAQKGYQEALIYADHSKAVKTFQKLSQVRAQLSKLSFAGPGAKGIAEYKSQLNSLEAQKEKLEAQLSKLSETYAVSRKIARADRNKVAQKLPPNSVLLEFAKILMFNFKPTGKKKRWQSAHYITFILKAGDGEDVRMVDLGRSDEIDKAIFEFKKEIADVEIKNLKKTDFLSKRLYELIFKPLKNKLGSAKEIFIAPDGNLNLLPFEIMQGPGGQFLIEEYTFNYLTAGRDVLGFGEKKDMGHKALLIGDPDFDLATNDRISIARNLNLDDTTQKRMSKLDSEMRGLFFSRLPGTKDEVMAIHHILGADNVEVFTDKKAVEELLYNRRAPKILHLATHGFFLKDSQISSAVQNQSPRGLSLSKNEYQISKMENLLLRSGIALAGANHSLKFRQGKEADGIVTAEKILGLNLYGTDMVVLSACETGLGKVKTGEGVFGLRRAFMQAGAKSLVMSMWSVPDNETKELMVEFYRNIAPGRMNKCQALRQAALRQMTVVEARYGHKNPFYWGAFVFLGEP